MYIHTIHTHIYGLFVAGVLAQFVTKWPLNEMRRVNRLFY